MKDKIVKIEDFKKLMEQKNLKREELRFCVMNKVVSEMSTEVYVLLSIPVNENTIMECLLARGLYLSVFLNDKETTDYKHSRELIKAAEDKTKKLFGDIIPGRWDEEEK